MTDPAGDSLDFYTRAAQRAANQVITSYSTSFSGSTRLFGQRHRQHIRNIYALVRIADELVDGVGTEAGLDVEEQSHELADLLQQTHAAIERGYSSNLIVHAFAHTARLSGIGADLIDPFFASMETDLSEETTQFDDAAHASYVYGSAQVVGLMCLKVFLREEDPPPRVRERLEHGARQLGGAFQDVNFLRDLADDTTRLGRGYLGTTVRLTSAQRDVWVSRIREQLDQAQRVIPLLPRDARAAVRAATSIFSELNNRIEAAAVEDIYHTRVRVPNPIKSALIAQALALTWREERA